MARTGGWMHIPRAAGSNPKGRNPEAENLFLAEAQAERFIPLDLGHREKKASEGGGWLPPVRSVGYQMLADAQLLSRGLLARH